MPGENVQDWSITASDNANSDTSINWAEGQPRASVNNSARSMMAAHAKDRNLKNGSITAGGTADALTFTSGVTYTAVPTGLRVLLKFSAANTGASTLAMDGLSAVAIKMTSGADTSAGLFDINGYGEFLYNGTNWIYLGSEVTPEFLTGAYLPLTGGTVTGNVVVTGRVTASNAVIGGAGVNFPLTVTGENTSVLYNSPARLWKLGADAGGEFALVDANTGIVYADWNPAAGINNFYGTYRFGSGDSTGPRISSIGLVYEFLAGNAVAFAWNTPTPGLLNAYVDNAIAYPLASASDERLKADIAPSTLDCLATVLQMPLFQYRWMDQAEPGVPTYNPAAPLVPAGLVAQRLYEVAPYCVRKGDDAGLAAKKAERDTRSVGKETPSDAANVWDIDRNNMLATLVGAVQQLTARVAQLEARMP